MSATINLWKALLNKPPSLVGSANSYLVSVEGEINMDVQPKKRPDSTVVLIPQPINGQGIAVLLVPDELTRQLSLNNSVLAAGTHILCHASHICWNSLRLWVARTDSARETQYEPHTHGKEMFCARTRSRLIPNEPIVICPGTLTDPCGMIYKKSAWLDIKCHHCGFDPNQIAWSPPQKGQSNINELTQLAE